MKVKTYYPNQINLKSIACQERKIINDLNMLFLFKRSLQLTNDAGKYNKLYFPAY